MRSVAVVGAVILAVALLVSCASPAGLPRYPSMPADDALEWMWRRDATVTSVRGPCRVVILDGRGRRVAFDGAFAARDGGDLRLQCWKLGEDLIDLTRNRDGHWVWANHDRLDAFAADLPDPDRDQPGLIELADVLTFFVDPPDLRGGHDPHDASTARALSVKSDGRVARMDPDTLTIRSYGPDDRSRRNVIFEYARVGDTARVIGLRMNRPSAELSITLERPQFNGPIPDAVFTPPRRARKVESP